MIEWIWRLYLNMVAVTGLKGRPPKKGSVYENSILSGNESLNLHACGNSSTMISSKEH